VRLKFYFDEDSADRALLDALRARGFSVLAPAETGLLGADDQRQLRGARKTNTFWSATTLGIFADIIGSG
jgi:hypothetical protein